MIMKKSQLWAPVSSVAYGANAVFIPEYGKPGTLEFILVMVQNYPEFKTHPALDVFHGYVKGLDRFKENHEFRVLSWDIDLARDQWSFLYLPTLDNTIRARVEFVRNQDGYLKMDITMENPSSEPRQWEFHLYCNPCEGDILPNYELHYLDKRKCDFDLNGVNMQLIGTNIQLRDLTRTDSNMWINFPLNAECSFDPYNPRSRYKQRLKLRTRFIDIPANSIMHSSIEFLPNGVKAPAEIHPFIPSCVNESDLPYRHILWQAIHNQQYTKSFNSDTMLIRHLPARQWGCFWTWDNGMTAIGITDFDENYAAAIISEMPDPAIFGKEIYKYGSFIITAIYALWELYQNTGNKIHIANNYDKLAALCLKMFEPYENQDCDGMVTANRGSGADDSPALFYAFGEIFAWDYQKTLPTNADHERLTLICAGLTAHAIRELKILRIFADILGRNGDVEKFSDIIAKTEVKLNEKYWSNKENCYLDKVISEDHLLDIPWIYGYLPLFSGSVPPERQATMIADLFQNKEYFTPNGLTIVEPSSPYYRDHGYPNGSIWHPLQYLFWKMCYSTGNIQFGKAIADRFLALWDKGHPVSLCCWEHHRVDTGAGAGNSRFSSFTTPAISIYKALRIPKSVQAGHDILLKTRMIDENCLSAKLVLFSPFYNGKSSVSIVLLPDTAYQVEINNQFYVMTHSDKYGWLGIDFEISRQQTISLVFSKK